MNENKINSHVLQTENIQMYRSSFQNGLHSTNVKNIDLN